MTNIVLFCSAGMSTSMLIGKMEKAAQGRGLEVKVNAYSESQVNKYVDDADVVLLGPQIRFALAKIKKICDEKGIPIDVIAPQDYGMMNGEKVLDQALRLLKK
jgi:PTS system cellobiose-specific IIB component